tara:strand:+ start:402 stop:626 length:225 start_codon:yes stop_codon:yes gene_type:complete
MFNIAKGSTLNHVENFIEGSCTLERCRNEKKLNDLDEEVMDVGSKVSDTEGTLDKMRKRMDKLGRKIKAIMKET